MEISARNVMKYLTEIEAAAEDIIIDKEQIVELDRKRNKIREAKRALHHDIQTESDGTKTWMCVGNMFLKVPKTKAVVLLENDYKELDAEINKLRKDLKPKVGKLRDLEGKSRLTAFDLNPLSKEELKAVEKS